MHWRSGFCADFLAVYRQKLIYYSIFLRLIDDFANLLASKYCLHDDAFLFKIERRSLYDI